MTEHTEAGLRRSRQALHAARVLLDAGDVEDSINRIYYAAFYVASAALHVAGEQTRTHSGLVDRFWVRFVKTGRIEPDVAHALREAFRARQRADYDFSSRFDAMAATDLLEDVETFVEAVVGELTGPDRLTNNP